MNTILEPYDLVATRYHIHIAFQPSDSGRPSYPSAVHAENTPGGPAPPRKTLKMRWQACKEKHWREKTHEPGHHYWQLIVMEWSSDNDEQVKAQAKEIRSAAEARGERVPGKKEALAMARLVRWVHGRTSVSSDYASNPLAFLKNSVSEDTKEVHVWSENTGNRRFEASVFRELGQDSPIATAVGSNHFEAIQKLWGYLRPG
ncbi:hypothetical protein BU26DRAFT_563208 [Trematosphaeria pertusa]|uniref:Uncharacterized protein n=1 Tax=Trematosphaeria pertusa TaxID=390896 RepID=A0A6A6ILI5_9PLEO|nr:uncharacterized protein BU26DRAFT_563208 [Trematosphaeria pertusa]KAF2251266.1 hypothetical protein BU26DRAFT_563208 [Trematosphaeria pertusa]